MDLSKQQRKVALEVVNGKSVSVIEGLPGTGKTTLMREIVRQYKKAGYDVLGVAVSASASRELGFAADIKALSITKFRYLTENLSYKEFRKKGSLTMDYYKEVNPLKANILSNKQLVIVDESSMVDLTEMHYILKEVEKAGAKLIVLGDRNQLPAIGSMGAAEKVAEIYGVSRLDEVRRQSNLKHREATQLLSRFKIEEAIKLYRETDTFRFSRTHQIAKDQLVKDYVAKYLDIYNAQGKDLGKDVLGANAKDNQNLQGQKQHQHNHNHNHKDHDLISSKIVALSYTNEDIAYLNKEIRSRLIDNGVISGQSKTFNINNTGERNTIELAKGDQIVFTKNDNYLGVVNSDIGEVVGFGIGGTLLVRLQNDSRSVSLLDSMASSIFGNSGRIIEIDNTKFKGFDYGYSKSVHKTQGKTFDFVLGMFDKYIGYFIFNVMATRHRESLKIYASDEILNEELYRKISLDPSNAKLDYKIKADNNDPESHRYAALVGLAQKRVDTSLAVDYIRRENGIIIKDEFEESSLLEESKLFVEMKDNRKESRTENRNERGIETQKEILAQAPSQIVLQYSEIKNEVIKIRQSVDSWLSLERAKGRVHHYNDHPYSHELKDKLEIRKDLACHITDNYEEFKRLLTQYKINFNTLEKHSGKGQYKYFFNRKDYNGDIRDIDGFKTILDEQSKLSKYGQIQYGLSSAVTPLFAKAIEESRKIIHEISSNLLSEIEELRLNVFKCQKGLEDAIYQKDRAIDYIEEGNNFIHEGIHRSLYKIYKDSPNIVLQRWNDLQKERGLEYALKDVHKDPEILGKMNGVGLLGISITSGRAEAHENASTLDLKLLKYEEYKKTIPELEDKLTPGLKLEISEYDACILKQEVELKSFELKLPNYAIREFIKSSYEASKNNSQDITKDQDQASSILSWAKDEKTSYECDQYRDMFAEDNKTNYRVNNQSNKRESINSDRNDLNLSEGKNQDSNIDSKNTKLNEKTRSKETQKDRITENITFNSKISKPRMREDIRSKDYLKNRDTCLERYEYSNGRDDRSKLCRNIAGSVQPDLAYSILRDFSFRSISQDKEGDNKAVFLVDINVYEQYQEKELDRIKDTILMSAQHVISYDVKEVEILPYEGNAKNLKNIENIRNIYQVNKGQMSEIDERCIRRVLEDQLFDAKDVQNLTFTAGDHLKLEIDTHKLFQIIINTRRNSGEELESYIEREEILAVQEIYQGRDKRAGILLKENEHARSLNEQNRLAAQIFCENLVDLHMTKGTSSYLTQKEGHINGQDEARNQTTNFSNVFANELPLNKIQIEQQKLIAIEQAEIIKSQRDIAMNIGHSNHDNHINQANQANHINKLYKNEKIFTKSLMTEDQKAKEEYIKYGSNKALEANLLSKNRVKLDVAKVQEITNKEVHKVDETLFKLQKQYKIERHNEMQQDRQRQMSRGMDR